MPKYILRSTKIRRKCLIRLIKITVKGKMSNNIYTSYKKYWIIKYINGYNLQKRISQCTCFSRVLAYVWTSSTDWIKCYTNKKRHPLHLLSSRIILPKEKNRLTLLWASRVTTTLKSVVSIIHFDWWLSQSNDLLHPEYLQGVSWPRKQ